MSGTNPYSCGAALPPLLLASLVACAAGSRATYAGAAADVEAPAPVAGEVQRRHLSGDPAQVYYLFIPSAGGADAPVLVTVHGISRNAREHAWRFARLAEAYGVVVVAPLFPSERYPDFQRLGRSGRGARADRALDAILAEVGRLTGAQTEHIHLFGFSGGAQFAHRYAFAHPRRVIAMVLGAAGWYTFPNPQKAYPRGLDLRGRLPGVTFDLDAALTIPATIVVGERDTKRDAELNVSPRIDRLQGLTRLERGRRWVEAMRKAARARGLATSYAFVELPRSGHSFRRAVRRGGMADVVFTSLFGPPPAATGKPAGEVKKGAAADPIGSAFARAATAAR